MLQLRSIRYMPPDAKFRDAFPFNIPLIKALDTLELSSPVTIFVGENGTGKSTLLESIAAAVGSPTIGAESVLTDATLQHTRDLAKQLKLAWGKRTHRGFFLRSEDFFNFTKALSQMRSEMLSRLREIDEEYVDRSDYSRSLAKIPYYKSLGEMKERYGENLDANSHGESFLRLFQSRFVPNGLYLLDEPETPLSPMRQLAFLSMLKEMATQGAQFIIATHSPILMAFPDATIFSFDESPVRAVLYDDLPHVTLTKSFLNDPQQFLRHL